MKTVNVENIGQVSGIDYDFYCGLPAFMEGDKELSVLINNGTDFTSVEIPIKGSDVSLIELANPNYSIFTTGSKGAVYHLSSAEDSMLLNLSYDGIEVASGDSQETEYFPFVDSYEGLEEAAENFDVDMVQLMVALGF